jgi:hypothetical protein
MIRSNLPGTTRAALCLAILVAAAGCAKQPAPVAPDENDAQQARKDNAEVEALKQGIKDHPSLQAGSNNAGAPVHVDPYPHSSGMSGMGREMSEKWNEAHSGNHSAKP